MDHFRLTLSASYVPPFGELGARLDRALLHRVAVSTVRSFLVRVAASLNDGSDGARPPRRGAAVGTLHRAAGGTRPDGKRTYARLLPSLMLTKLVI